MEIKLDSLTPEQIESLKSQVAKMVEENSKPRELSVKELKNGFILDDVEIYSCRDYVSSYIDKAKSIGLWRPTREECEKLLKKMQIAERLRQWSLMCKEKVDFNNVHQTKYYAIRRKNEIDIYDVCTCKCNDIYFTEYSILQRAIADIGEQNLIENYFIEI